MDNEKNLQKKLDAKAEFIESSNLMLLLQQVQRVTAEDVERRILEETVEETERIKQDLAALREIQTMLAEMVDEQGETLQCAAEHIETTKHVVEQTQEILERLPKPWWYKVARCTII